MLVLSRKDGEEIVIGNNVRVEVLSIKGNTVRLGIKAPKEVPIVRGELEAEVQNQIFEFKSQDLLETA